MLSSLWCDGCAPAGPTPVVVYPWSCSVPESDHGYTITVGLGPVSGQVLHGHGQLFQVLCVVGVSVAHSHAQPPLQSRAPGQG